MNKAFIIIITIILSMVTGCSSTPRGVYSEGDMEDILYDYYKAKAMGNSLPAEEQYKAPLYVQSVFKKYHTTEAEFDSSLVWYTSHPDQFLDVYKKVDDRLNDELKSFSAGGNALAGGLPALQGDTTELWNASRFCLLSNTLFSRRMNFHVVADTSFHESDRFAWSFTVHLPGGGAGSGNLTAALCIQYVNDSIAGTTQNIYSSSPVSLMLEATPDLKIKSVYGFIYKSGGEAGDSSTPYSIALIDRFSLLRQHKRLPKMTGGSSQDSTKAAKDSTKESPDTSSRKKTVPLKGRKLIAPVSTQDVRPSYIRRRLQK